MKVGEIFVALGFKVDDGGLIDFEDSVVDLVFNLGALTAGATAALYAIDKFLEGPIKRARLITEFGKETGASTDELQKWIAVNEKFGFSAEETTAAIQGLAEKLYQIRYTGQGANAFAKLGIQVDGTEDPFTILRQLREKIKDPACSRLDFANIMKEMGISPKFIQGLEKSNEEFNRLAGNIAQLQDETRVLAELGSAIDEITQKLRMAQAHFVVDNMGGIRSGIDLLYDIANALSDAADELDYLWQRMEGFQDAAKTVAAGVLLAWNPFFTSIAFAVKGLQELKQFRDGDNSREAVDKRRREGKTPFAGDGYLPSIFNWIEKQFTLEKSQTRPQSVLDPARSTPGHAVYRIVDVPVEKKTDVSVTNNIEIHTSEDGEAFGEGLGKTLGTSLQSEIQKTNTEVNNGVNY